MNIVFWRIRDIQIDIRFHGRWSIARSACHAKLASGGGESNVQFFKSEDALNSAVLDAARTDVWTLGEAHECVIVKTVALHDEQLSCTSAKDFVESMEKLERLIRVGYVMSPIEQCCAVTEHATSPASKSGGALMVAEGGVSSD
jgi:hypothetical protein